MGACGSSNRGVLKASVKAEIERKLNDAPGLDAAAYSTDRVEEVAAYSFLELRSQLVAKKERLPEVVKILHRKKQLQNNSLCNLTDVFYSEPLTRATDLQAQLDTNPEVTLAKYPLLGCVLSIKDSAIYKGSSSTQGFYKGYGKPYSESAPLIEHLETLGAVIVCKGNVPQALMSCESSNLVFGVVSNPGPGHSGRIAGGSSGGEAANIASRIVNAAIGSDIAGSLRFPAFFCGIYSIKVTAGRLSTAEGISFAEKWGAEYGKTGDMQMIILPTCGPMARTAADVEAMLIPMINFNSITLEVPPLPWRPVQDPSTILKRVGVLKPFFLLEPSAVQIRALHEASSLISPETETVDIDLNDLFEEMVVTSIACFLKDSESLNMIRGTVKLGSNDKLADIYDEFKTLASAPVWILRLVAGTSLVSTREKLYIRAYLLSIDYNVAYIVNTQHRLREEAIKRFRAAGVSLLLAHGAPPALLKSTAKDCDLCCAYCFIWNLVNFPVAAVPITTVRKDEQTYTSAWDDKITKALQLNMAGSEGLPVGVQVVGLPWHEEHVVEAMKALERG